MRSDGGGTTGGGSGGVPSGGDKGGDEDEAAAWVAAAPPYAGMGEGGLPATESVTSASAAHAAAPAGDTIPRRVANDDRGPLRGGRDKMG